MVQTKMEQCVELSESTESNVFEICVKVWGAIPIFEMYFNTVWKEPIESDMFEI